MFKIPKERKLFFKMEIFKISQKNHQNLFMKQKKKNIMKLFIKFLNDYY